LKTGVFTRDIRDLLPTGAQPSQASAGPHIPL